MEWVKRPSRGDSQSTKEPSSKRKQNLVIARQNHTTQRGRDLRREAGQGVLISKELPVKRDREFSRSPFKVRVKPLIQKSNKTTLWEELNRRPAMAISRSKKKGGTEGGSQRQGEEKGYLTPVKDC